MKTSHFYVVSFFFSILFFSSCDDPFCVRGEGPLINETIMVNEPFTKIELEGSFDALISYGATTEVKAVGQENIIHHLITTVVGGELIVELEKNCYRNFDLDLHITLPHVERVTLDGSGDIMIQDFQDQEDLELQIIGSGDISLHEFSGTENLTVKIDGSGDVNLLHPLHDLQNLNVRISGSGDFAGYPAPANNCIVSIYGSGSARVHAHQSLNATIEGSGNIYYKGSPIVQQTLLGSGNVINRN